LALGWNRSALQAFFIFFFIYLIQVPCDCLTVVAVNLDTMAKPYEIFASHVAITAAANKPHAKYFRNIASCTVCAGSQTVKNFFNWLLFRCGEGDSSILIIHSFLPPFFSAVL
jgi:hypothetical protein